MKFTVFIPSIIKKYSDDDTMNDKLGNLSAPLSGSCLIFHEASDYNDFPFTNLMHNYHTA